MQTESDLYDRAHLKACTSSKYPFCQLAKLQDFYFDGDRQITEKMKSDPTNLANARNWAPRVQLENQQNTPYFEVHHLAY
jgi:hypothetical protein